MKTRVCFSQLMVAVSLTFLISISKFQSLAIENSGLDLAVPNNPNAGFTENKGQLSDDYGLPLDNVYFYAASNGFRVYVTSFGLSYFFLREKPIQKNGEAELSRHEILWERIDMELENADIVPEKIIPEKTISGANNYYLPGCPEGIIGVQTFQKITFKNIYEGIDWIITANVNPENGLFKQDFIVHPGADIASVRLHYHGTNSMITKIDDKILKVKSAYGEFNEAGLVGISNNNPIQMHYSEISKNIFGFIVDQYFDRSKDFVVDPNVLVWATYYGGSTLDDGKSICSNGVSVWTAGTTTSLNLPCQNPGGGAYYQGTSSTLQDLFILKFDALTSTRLGATYYGGSGIDSTSALHFDGTSVFVTGSTTSTNFPLQNPGGGAYYQATKSTAEDMFILKFNSSGVRQWATYYGGNGIDSGTSLFSNGVNLFVCGYSESTNFPTQNPGGGAWYQAALGGVQNATILKFTVAGVRNWSSYYGGDDTDIATSITVNGTNLYIVGQATSSNFPVLNPGGGAFYQGAQVDGPECFIARFNTSGVRSWSTYYGGSDDEGFSAAHCDGTSVWVTGYAVSSDFPVYNPGGGAYFDATQGADQSGTLLKFSLTGVRQWATFYGGNVNTEGNSIFSSGTSVWVTGRTESDDFFTLDPGNGAFYQPHNSDLPNIISESWDMFILEFNTACIVQWSTYYGKEEDDLGSSVWFDGTYLFISGTTVSGNDYLVDAGSGAYFQGSCGGCGVYNDAIILKFGVAIFTPVELIEFNAFAQKEEVITQWSTASEMNNDFFEVMHSTDGVDWANIGTVEGQGTCQSTHYYSFAHENPFVGINYYRLKQTDYNGESEYSDIVSVWIEIQSTTCYPNPTSGVIYISGSFDSTTTFMIYNSIGNLIGKLQTNGSIPVSFDLSPFPPGLYTCKFLSKNNSDTYKILKQ